MVTALIVGVALILLGAVVFVTGDSMANDLASVGVGTIFLGSITFVVALAALMIRFVNTLPASI